MAPSALCTVQLANSTSAKAVRREIGAVPKGTLSFVSTENLQATQVGLAMAARKQFLTRHEACCTAKRVVMTCVKAAEKTNKAIEPDSLFHAAQGTALASSTRLFSICDSRNHEFVS